MNILPHALTYAARGWPVLPCHSIKGGRCTCCKAACHSQGKHPKTWHGLKDATTDPKIIKRWWRRWPGANIGIRTGEVSGIVAIDVDPRHSGDKTLANLLAEHGELPLTVTADTGGGGSHFLFARPGESIRSRSNVLQGIDVRGESGFIIAPPSNHLSARRYAWRDGFGPDGLALAAMPDWLLELVGNGARDTERAEKAEKAERMSSTLSVSSSEKISDIIASTLPSGPGRRHRAIFELCRALKAEPALADADHQTLRPIVAEWHRQALPVIATKAFEESWIDFLQAWPKVRYAAGAGPMDAVSQSAKVAQTPPEAMDYERPELRLLVAVCRELQNRAGDGPFFISCRTAGKLLGVGDMTAWRWLLLLQADGVLVLAEPGTKRRAARYFYKGGKASKRGRNNTRKSLPTVKRDENTCREPFAATEYVAMGRAIEKVEKPKAKERVSEGGKKGKRKKGRKSFPTFKRDESKRTTAVAAKAAGASVATPENALPGPEDNGEDEHLAAPDDGEDAPILDPETGEIIHRDRLAAPELDPDAPAVGSDYDDWGEV